MSVGSLVHGRRLFGHEDGVKQRSRAVVGRIINGLGRKGYGLETLNEADHRRGRLGFGLVGWHPLRRWLSLIGKYRLAFSLGEEVVHCLRNFKHIGQNWSREHLCIVPAAVEFGLEGFEFGSHLGHGLVVGEVVEHETESVQ